MIFPLERKDSESCKGIEQLSGLYLKIIPILKESLPRSGVRRGKGKLDKHTQSEAAGLSFPLVAHSMGTPRVRHDWSVGDQNIAGRGWEGGQKGEKDPSLSKKKRSECSVHFKRGTALHLI